MTNNQSVAKNDTQEHTGGQLDGNLDNLQKASEQQESNDGILLADREQANVEQQTGNDDAVAINGELMTVNDDNMETNSEQILGEELPQQSTRYPIYHS